MKEFGLSLGWRAQVQACVFRSRGFCLQLKLQSIHLFITPNKKSPLEWQTPSFLPLPLNMVLRLSVISFYSLLISITK